jgi:hypothetical protein
MSKDFKSFLSSMNEKEETTAPAPAPAEAEVTIDSPEIALDPKLEKEIWLSSFDIAGKIVVIKSLGLGPTQPVVVYIDDKRWEVFPGPKSAKSAVRRHIKGNMKSTSEDIDVSFESFLSEAMFTKSEVLKWLTKHKRKFETGTEAAFAVADEFGLDNELENQKHWIWTYIKKMFKGSVDFKTLVLTATKLADGTKIELDENLSQDTLFVYNLLDDTNKMMFREAFIINKNNHKKVINFVKEQMKGSK